MHLVQVISLEQCAKGKHRSAAFPNSCLSCAVGKFQDKVNQTECKFCVEGQFQASTGQEKCELCAEGKFQYQEGQIDCEKCTRGTFAENKGAVSCNLCITKNTKTYQDEAGKAECKTCTQCTTDNAKSGFGQACISSCIINNPSTTFLLEIIGQGYMGELNHNQQSFAEQVFSNELRLQNSTNVKLFLQSVKNTEKRRLQASQYHVYEAAVFEKIQFLSTLTVLEDTIKQKLNELQGITVKSLRAVTSVENNMNATNTESDSFGTENIVGVGIGATLVAGIAAYSKASEAFSGAEKIGVQVVPQAKQNEQSKTNPQPKTNQQLML